MDVRNVYIPDLDGYSHKDRVILVSNLVGCDYSDAELFVENFYDSKSALLENAALMKDINASIVASLKNDKMGPIKYAYDIADYVERQHRQ